LVVEPASDPNSAPIVDAGDDQEIYMNQSLTLAGTINNDPGDWIQSVVWSCASPNVSFDNTADPAASVIFSASGDYTLRLTVSDGAGTTAFDEVFVRVRPEARPPIAEIFNLANDPKHLKPDPVLTEGLLELRVARLIPIRPMPSRIESVCSSRQRLVAIRISGLAG
jgi:hypothetical protein